MSSKSGAEKQFEIYRSMSGQERLRIAFQLWEISLELMRASERFMDPSLSADEIERRVRRRVRLGATECPEKDNRKA